MVICLHIIYIQMYLADDSIWGELRCIQGILFFCWCIPWIDFDIAMLYRSAHKAGLTTI